MHVFLAFEVLQSKVKSQLYYLPCLLEVHEAQLTPHTDDGQYTKMNTFAVHNCIFRKEIKTWVLNTAAPVIQSCADISRWYVPYCQVHYKTITEV